MHPQQLLKAMSGTALHACRGAGSCSAEACGSCWSSSLWQYFWFSGDSFAVSITLTIVSMLMCFAVASVIFWRKSNDWMALLVTLMLVMGGTTYVTNILQRSLAPERAPALILSNITFVVFFLVFCLFPDGRLVPRWIGWLLVVWITWSTI